VGEFEDSALLTVFASRGLGVFPMSQFGVDQAGFMHGLRMLGQTDEVKQEIHAIRSRRGEHHPLVRQILASAQGVVAS
jgi:LysR family transcriptional regulator, transcriptional activator of nhaA